MIKRRKFVQNSIAGFLATTFGPSLSRCHGVAPIKPVLLPDEEILEISPDGKVSAIRPTDTVGKIPVRKDITVLPADNPKELKLKLGWIIYEKKGWCRLEDQIANLDTGEVFYCGDWTDFDWEIFNLIVHNNKADHKKIPTDREIALDLINKAKANPKKYNYIEMYCFVYDRTKNKSTYWEEELLYKNKFNEWINGSCAGSIWGSSEHSRSIFPQNESDIVIQCTLALMENAIKWLIENDPDKRLGCHILTNEYCEYDPQEIHCYDAIKDEKEVWRPRLNFFAEHHRLPTREEEKILSKEYQESGEKDTWQQKVANPKKLPKKFQGKWGDGTVVINDYATGKVTVSGHDG